MLSAENFIGIKCALRYKAIVINCSVSKVITSAWISILLFKFTGLIYDMIIGTELINLLILVCVYTSKLPLFIYFLPQ